ncbi:RHS domain-containing protein, partial [Hydrogenophaga aromaticivorans]|uniref:RHS repeat-associated core domain-containing protein n=1 Tax=Hydrogenophaga aromaticivorans TaxID=2610898 RepID=UPI001B3645E5
HSDHLGTPRRITNESGQPVWQWAYSAYGDNAAQVLAAAEPGFTFNPRFPGQYFDSESGKHYNYFRTYDPTTGRYTSADPIGLAGGWNRFGYVGGNPLSFTDPTGLKHKANSAHCSALRKKMQDLQNDLDDRWSDLAADRLSLPERLGPSELLSQTKRGHRTMINDRESKLRKFEKRYSNECEDDDDNGSGQSCDTGCAAVGAAVSVGAGYVAYRCLRMLPSLFPPLWPTIPANLVAP